MPKISCFNMIKNESEHIGYCIMSVYDYVDEFIYADGNSTDGTIEIIEYIKKKYDKQNKIKLFKNKDCKNLHTDYERLFNWILKQCTGDYLWFLHPDMMVTNPKLIRESIKDDVRYSVNTVSIAGENREFIISKGRTNRWCIIYKNDYGLHYYGAYGNQHEDFYFKDFTGNQHLNYDFIQYLPYEIIDTKINVIHYCDTKPYSRRLDRMKKILKFSDWDGDIEAIAKTHPRVNLKDGYFQKCKFEFIKNSYTPGVFEKYKEFEKFRKI